MWNSIIIISVIGTLAHFLYDISNHNKIVGLFTAVNESVWEHIKLALTPTFLMSLYDGFIYGNNLNYFPAKILSILLIIIVIPSLFYFFKFIFGRSIMIIDISIFYITIILSQTCFRYILNITTINYLYRYLSCVLLFIVFGSYLLLTLLPLELDVFKDPISNKYGYDGHRY